GGAPPARGRRGRAAAGRAAAPAGLPRGGAALRLRPAADAGAPRRGAGRRAGRRAGRAGRALDGPLARAPGQRELEIAGGWRLMPRPDFHGDVAALRKKVEVERLSPAALETLAVVAYRQPIGRAEIEAVRGVACGPVLRLLLERDLI